MRAVLIKVLTNDDKDDDNEDDNKDDDKDDDIKDEKLVRVNSSWC